MTAKVFFIHQVLLLVRVLGILLAILTVVGVADKINLGNYRNQSWTGRKRSILLYFFVHHSYTLQQRKLRRLKKKGGS